MDDKQGPVVVLFSGGQDSTTCLAWALEKFGDEHVWPLSFYYGQRHEIELEQARLIAGRFGLHDRLEFMSAVQLQTLGSAALTNPDISVDVNAKGTGNVYAEKHDLPSTFVPGRNLFFFTLAAAYGAKLGATDLVTGVCEADHAGYPDCRATFVGAAQYAIRLALDEDWTIHAPLLQRSKGATFKLAQELGVLDLVLEDTHTCYHGDRSTRHAWGYGCGECGACKERALGWEEFQNAEAIA